MKKHKYSASLIWDTKTKKNIEEKSLLTTLEKIKPNLITNIQGYLIEEQYVECDYVNKLIHGDNLKVMQALIESGYKGKLDLIYLDPPYLSNINYNSNIIVATDDNLNNITRLAFKDTWKKGLDSYLDMMYPRLLLMKELLSENGSIFVHLDWHVSHYIKILLDEIFSPNNFINEIIWCYSGGSNSKKSFQKKHDTIFWYAKSPDYIFNPQYRDYTDGTKQRGLTSIKGDKYKLNEKGALMQDWWVDINKILSPTAYENLKYPTQKPQKLIERIIKSASNKGNLVADFFCGSGTLGRVSNILERNWIMCDSSDIAISTAKRSLLKFPNTFTVNTIENRSYNTTTLINKKPKIISKNFNFATIEISLPEYYPDINMIDYWEIDLQFNGELFNSQMQLLKDKKSSEIIGRITVDIIIKESNTIAIKTTDYHGNTNLNIQTFKL